MYIIYITEPNNQTLTKYFERVAEWKKLAAFLLNDDDGSKTHLIEKSNHYDVGDCRGAMIREYLKSGNISWETVLSCLRSAGYKNLADDIEKDLNIDLSIQGYYTSCVDYNAHTSFALITHVIASRPMNVDFNSSD